METRVCKVCGREFPLTDEFFKCCDITRNYFLYTCNDCRRVQEKEYREARKAANDERMARVREATKRWKKEHHDKHIAQVVRRTRERQREDPVYKWTLEARRAARCPLTPNKARCFSDDRVRSITGLSKSELRDHLLSTFRELYGYEWDGIEPTHVDHIIPLCTEDTIDGRKRLFDYHNLRLIKEKDNRAKGTSVDYIIAKRSAEEIAKRYADVLPDDA